MGLHGWNRAREFLVHDTYANLQRFAWQEGYGAFSVNVSLIEETIRYIERQAEHHRRKTFQEEYVEFLERRGIEYDEQAKIQSSRWDFGFNLIFTRR